MQLKLVSLVEFCCVFTYQNNECYRIEFYFGYIYTFHSVSETSVSGEVIDIVNSVHNVIIVWIRLDVNNC